MRIVKETSATMSSIPTLTSWGCWKEKRESKELKIYLKIIMGKIMREAFLNLVKEIDIQVQEAQRISNKMNLNRLIPKYIMIKMPKIKDKEGIFKAAREKELVTYMGAPIRLPADSQQKLCRPEEIGKKYSK